MVPNMARSRRPCEPDPKLTHYQGFCLLDDRLEILETPRHQPRDGSWAAAA